MGKDQKWIIGAIAGLVLVCMCAGVSCLTAGGLAAFRFSRMETQEFPDVQIPQVITEGSKQIEPSRTPSVGGEAAPVDNSGALETLNTLEEEIVPINDPRDLALRLEGKANIPETVERDSRSFKIGDQDQFWVANNDTNEHRQTTATLRYITDHLYFWIEEGVRYDEQDLKRLADAFETKMYPTNRSFFGSEWSPGIDNDPHLNVLYARGLGETIAGYFSSADEIHPEAHEYSNAREMFMMSADNVDLGEDYIYGTMAHEFQHMIHWYRDRNEESWMNEGFSVLAQLLNGYETGMFDLVYVQDPDMQLTFWPSSPDSQPHYGASFLFVAYFLDRFGDEATQAVVEHPENGMDSIDTVLTELNQVDPLTGKAIQADDVFADWVVTSFLNDPAVSDGRYAYQRYDRAPQPEVTEEVRDCSQDWEPRSVHQYGADYIRINCSGEYTLHLEGEAQVGVLPVEFNSGDYAFWSNKGDESNMTLTRAFDFSGENGPLTLQYQTWYDLEEDYDYLYVLASEDGENWEILKTPSGTDQDPSGNSYGWGYNGQSGGWIEERVDLSEFAGKKIQLRFEYVTDAAVNGEGFLLDDVQIPEIDYRADFEQDEEGWEGNGFARIRNSLPQIFRVSLIRNGREVSVENFTMNSGEPLSIPLQFNGDLEDAVLVVSGVTRFTTQEAAYRFRFEQ